MHKMRMRQAEAKSKQKKEPPLAYKNINEILSVQAVQAAIAEYLIFTRMAKLVVAEQPKFAKNFQETISRFNKKSLQKIESTLKKLPVTPKQHQSTMESVSGIIKELQLSPLENKKWAIEFLVSRQRLQGRMHFVLYQDPVKVITDEVYKLGINHVGNSEFLSFKDYRNTKDAILSSSDLSPIKEAEHLGLPLLVFFGLVYLSAKNFTEVTPLQSSAIFAMSLVSLFFLNFLRKSPLTFAAATQPVKVGLISEIIAAFPNDFFEPSQLEISTKPSKSKIYINRDSNQVHSSSEQARITTEVPATSSLFLQVGDGKKDKNTEDDKGATWQPKNKIKTRPKIPQQLALSAAMFNAHSFVRLDWEDSRFPSLSGMLLNATGKAQVEFFGLAALMMTRAWSNKKTLSSGCKHHILHHFPDDIEVDCSQKTLQAHQDLLSIGHVVPAIGQAGIVYVSEEQGQQDSHFTDARYKTKSKSGAAGSWRAGLFTICKSKPLKIVNAAEDEDLEEELPKDRQCTFTLLFPGLPQQTHS